MRRRNAIIFSLVTLCLLIWQGSAQSRPIYFTCPYVFVGDAWFVSVHTLTEALCTARGLSPCNDRPGRMVWIERQLEDATLTPQALVYAELDTAEITLFTAEGCSEVTRGALVSDLAQPEESRTILRQKRNAQGRAIAPIRAGLLTVMEGAVPSRGALLQRKIETLIARLIGPSIAMAQLGSFCSTCIPVDNFNRTNETPLAAPYDVYQEAAECNLTSNTVKRPSGTACGDVNTSFVTADNTDISIDYTAGTGQLELAGRLSNLGGGGDGYQMKPIPGSSTITMYRIDAGSKFSLGSNCTSITQTAPMTYGIRLDGAQGPVGYLGGSSVCDRTANDPGTYTAGGFIAFTNLTSDTTTLDNLQATPAPATPTGKATIWWLR